MRYLFTQKEHIGKATYWSCIPVTIHMNTSLNLPLHHTVWFCCFIPYVIFEQNLGQTEVLMVQDAFTIDFLYNFLLHNLNLNVTDFWKQWYA